MTLSSAKSDLEVLASVLDNPRSLVRVRVLRSARRLIAERGLDVSMEELAVAAGLSRRTLFRHFESHERLVADAVSSSIDWYDLQVDAVTKLDEPFESWLFDVVSRIHEMHRLAGKGIWELAAADETDLTPQLAVVNQRRRADRRQITVSIAESAWVRAGGRGQCPSSVVNACALMISSFATRSMIDDFGSDPGSLAEEIASLLGTVIRAEVQASVGTAKSDRAEVVRKRSGASSIDKPPAGRHLQVGSGQPAPGAAKRKGPNKSG